MHRRERARITSIRFIGTRQTITARSSRSHDMRQHFSNNHRDTETQRVWRLRSDSLLQIGFIALLLTFPLTISAHRLDEYLQATRLSIATDGIVLKMDLTPGVDVGPMIFALINTNRDGRISETEGKAYANRVLRETVLEVDGTRHGLELVSYQFPSFQEMSTGTGVIRIEARTAWASA